MSAEHTKTALIAMSGGVDSSVAAYRMQQQGYRCVGATMRLYRNEDLGLSRYRTCCAQQDIDDAAEVAFRLDIPFQVPDCTAQFRSEVIDRFVRSYESGGTPNPCIDCNRYMKFGHLLRLAEADGLDCVVTGHYARIVYDASSGRYLLKKALDQSKDQSYVLYMLTQTQLARVRFPLGEMTKEETRAIAGQLGLCNADKPDSQDICFVPDGDYAGFMERYTGRRYPPGQFLDPSGKCLGTHRGAVRYTVGQRRGLGLALGEPAYVLGKDMAANTVTVGPEALLFADALLAEDLNWISVPALEAPMRVKAKIRYRQAEQWATVSPAADGRVLVRFDAPQRAVTAGQAIVFYDGDTVVGGGTIARALRPDAPPEGGKFIAAAGEGPTK